MPRPTLNFPTRIQILNVTPGKFGSSGGGGLLKGAGDLSVRIDGDDAGVFSVSRLETQALVSDPDVPGSPRSWQTDQVVQGAGPISAGLGEALLVTVTFACPLRPQQAVFGATAVVVVSNTAQPPLLRIPITATVAVVPERLDIVSLVTPRISAGQTANFEFQLTSSFHRDIGGVFTCDSTPPTPFSSDTEGQFPTVPAGGTLPVTLAVTCAPGTATGNYPVVFRLRAVDNSAEFGSCLATITVVAARSVSVITNLASDLPLGHGSSTLCEIRATVSGGPGTFNVTPGSVPDGIALTNGQQSLAVDGSVFVGLTINVDLQAPVGRLPAPLVINWSVPADDFHPEASGQLVFNIVTPKRRIMFGLESFKVENCRSKGDHNDSDTLFVVVSTNKDVQPGQQIVLGNNLHAGDPPVQDKFVGPFEIDDTELVSVTYTVVNGADGNDTAEIAAKITAVVLGTVGGLDEAHFMGLVARKIEVGIFVGAAGIFGTFGELLGIHPSDPDCSGAVLVRTFPFAPGQLGTGPQRFGPVTETQKSPSKCGNDPHSTVVYLAKQVS